MTDPTVIRKSVTADDYAETPYSSSNIFFMYPTAYGAPQYTPLPAWWSVQRDFVLRGTIHRESMWADAVFKAITKTAALGFEIEDSEDSKVRTRRGQDIYMTALAGMHRGWVPFLSMHLRDFLLTDNGAFVEIIRSSSAAGSRIMGIAHLDAARCTRTGDPDVPVLYRDRLGKWHEMRWWQVMTFADMPDPAETWNGVGFCAASRAFLTLAKLAALEQYMYEKAAGDGATELSFLKGISNENLASAILTADGEQKRKGAVYYKGKIVVGIMGDVPLENVNIPLKNVPDGFDWKQERDNAYLVYANALGIPVQDIQPLSGQGLGTGTQTIILSEEAEGQGLAAWRSQWIHQNNTYILPESTTFTWSNKYDTRDAKAKAEAQNLQADVIVKLIGNPTAPGIISTAQGLNLAADWDLVPQEFLPVGGDATPGGSLSDDEKPVDAVGMIQQALPLLTQQLPQAQPDQPALPVTNPIVKEINFNRYPSLIAHAINAGHITIAQADEMVAHAKVKQETDNDDLIDEQLDAALALVSRVLKKGDA